METAGKKPKSTSALTILVVDEDANALNLITTVLTDIGVRWSLEARAVDRALEVLATGRVDCLVLDWLDQSGQGLHLVRFIRTSPESPDNELPIVLCTAHRTAREISEARDAGVSEIVAKPFSHAAMESKIKAAMFRRRPFVRSVDFAGPDRRRHRRNWLGEDRRVGDRTQLSQDEIDTLMKNSG